MADRVESKSPLEGILVKGIQYIHITSLSGAQPQTYVCHALAIGPKMRCTAGFGRQSFCDRALRLYRLPDSIQMQGSIPFGEKVVVEPQDDKNAVIKIFDLSYKIHAPEEGKLSIAKLDFSQFANEHQNVSEIPAWDYVHQMLKEASKDGA
jgi:hypothetical protein